MSLCCCGLKLLNSCWPEIERNVAIQLFHRESPQHSRHIKPQLVCSLDVRGNGVCDRIISCLGDPVFEGEGAFKYCDIRASITVSATLGRSGDQPLPPWRGKVGMGGCKSLAHSR
jgi:hypothetical protein